MERILPDLAALEAEARTFVASLMPRAAGATLVTLSGELGAGKTTFTQAVARALGIEESVTSPTFVLEKVYTLTNSPFSRLIHIDAYRLKGGAELAPLNFHELMEDTGNLILLEWPERVADAFLVPAQVLTLAVLDDQSRKITYGHV